ncbi:ankyrin repeat domain-containing protein [Candidatus Pacearchaeota archaeon]|nr:ankyrin repeat domain-containing protein [Candidatus Pacearchaeota archaeon]
MNLIDAVDNNDIQQVQHFVEQGDDIHIYNDLALRLAALNGHFEIVKYCIENGADIHAAYDNALRGSAKNGHFDVVKYCIENGADILAIDHYIMSIAVNKNYFDVVKYLIPLYPISELKELFSEIDNFYIKFLILERIFNESQ